MKETLYPHQILLKYKYFLVPIAIIMSTSLLIMYLLSIIIPAINGTIDNATLMQPQPITQPVCCVGWMGFVPLLVILFIAGIIIAITDKLGGK